MTYERSVGGPEGQELVAQARALGSRIRYDIYRFLGAADRPVGVNELTEQFGVNHNTIRRHLQHLVNASLLVETKAPSQGRGRPQYRYELDSATHSRWGGEDPYEQLSLWLSETLRTEDPPLEVGRREGRRRGAKRPVETWPGEGLVAEMASQGFAPRVSQQGSSLQVTLDRCPFESAAVADPETVCDLHLGLAQGLAETSAGLQIKTLIRRDPRVGGCVLACHVNGAS